MKRKAAALGAEAMVRLPITPKLLWLLQGVWSGNSSDSDSDSIMLRTACT